jgi:biotin/methionine sulfoxide reductase
MPDTIPTASHWGAFSALVQDGRITGVRPFAQDSAPSPIIHGTAEAVHGKNRIDRPYVRRGWLNGDRAGGTPRGQDRFVAVDWDVATRLVAGEIGRVRDEHGPASIFGGSYGWASAGRFHHAKTQLQRMLSVTGGFTTSLMSYSYAAAQAIMPHVVGDMDCVVGATVDWRAIAANARVMLCFGGVPLRNGQIINGGGGQHDMGFWLRHAAASGVRLVNISPDRRDMPADVPAEWVPIRPGTDTALMLAMAHVLITEGLVDAQFLDRCTIGYDRLRAYILAENLTPTWASAITGIDAYRIVDLAREVAAKPTMLTAAWSLQRAEYGEQPFWMLAALAAMLGEIGKPGLGFGFGHGSIAGQGSPRRGLPSVSMHPLPNRAGSFIPVARIADMLENPGAEYDYNGRRMQYPDTRLIYWAGGNPFHHHQDLNRFARAWARTETIVVHEPWWTSAARHADIVLPATTTLERDDIASSGRDRFVLAMKQVVPPQGQARDDFAICADVADALGVRDRFTEQRDVPAWLRFLYGRWRDQIGRIGLQVPDFEAFWEAGAIEFPLPDGDIVPFEAFVRDPARHPVKTASGRIELFSPTIAAFRYDDCPGHPTWFPPSEYLGSARAAEYPLHLLTAQPETRLHGQMDAVGVSAASKISGREPIWLHPQDAADRGLLDGEIVRVFNDRGACLAGLRLTPDLLPGVAVLPTGAWWDPVEATCVHGNPNVLTRDVGTSRLGQGPVAQSCLVEVERFIGVLPPVTVHDRPAIEAA